jgi:glutamyl/glutaminyl-tRNA synthetase
MEAEFDIDRVSRSPAIFDIQKLNWLNGLYIRDLGHRDFHQAIEPFLGEVSDRYSAGQLAVAEAAVRCGRPVSSVPMKSTRRLMWPSRC